MDDFWIQVDRLAAELGVSPATRKKWRQRKAVPARWHVPLMHRAKRNGESLPFKRLMDMAAGGKRAA